MKILLLFTLFYIGWTASINNDILVMDCNGVVNFLPNNKLLNIKFDLKDTIGTYNLAHEVLYDRLKCKCPSVTYEEFKSRFAISSLDFWLAFITGGVTSNTCSQTATAWDQNYQTISSGLGSVTFDLKSCTYDSWKTNGHCFIQFKLPSFDMDLQVALATCSNSDFPFISITCNGEGCDKIGLFCLNNNECSPNHRCELLASLNDTVIFDGLKSSRIYDQQDSYPGCKATASFMEDIINFGRSIVWQNNAAFSFPNKPTLDFNICLPKNLTTDAFGCQMTQPENDTLVFSCSSLSDWDGKLADGTSAISESRMQRQIVFDQIPKISTGVPLVYHSPGNTFDFLPSGSAGTISGIITNYQMIFDAMYNNTNSSTTVLTSVFFSMAAVSNVKFQATMINTAANFWFPKNLDIQTCRAKRRGETLSLEDYKLRFAYILPALISGITNPGRKFSPAMSDWSISIIYSNTTSVKRLKIPETCSYERYLSDRTCALSFTGFQSLLQSDITLNLLAKDCPEYSLPAIYIECKGNDCDLLNNPHPCDSDTDCSKFPGTKCLPFTNTKNYDFMQAYFTHDIHPVDSCGSADLLKTDLQKVISHYIGTPVTQTKLCLMDFSSQNIDIDKWFTEQYIVDGDQYSIKDLGNWVPDSTEIPGTIDNSCSVISNSWILLLMIFFNFIVVIHF